MPLHRTVLRAGSRLAKKRRAWEAPRFSIARPSSSTRLEGDLQTELDLAWRAQRIDTGAGTHPVGKMTQVSGAVDAARLSRKQARHLTRRQIEIDEVEDVKGSDGWRDGKAILDFEVVG